MGSCLIGWPANRFLNFRFIFASTIRRGRTGIKRDADEAPAQQRPGDPGGPPCYPIHMKRTNLVVDSALLEEAVRLSGERTYSRTVERALQDFVRRIKARQILDLAGSGLWSGDLSVVRDDRPPFGDTPDSTRRRRGAR